MKMIKVFFICIVTAASIACVSRPVFVPTEESSEDFHIDFNEDKVEEKNDDQG